MWQEEGRLRETKAEMIFTFRVEMAARCCPS
jgi:hypothetical protein